jgi:hypothetical protein
MAAHKSRDPCDHTSPLRMMLFHEIFFFALSTAPSTKCLISSRRSGVSAS